MNIDDVLLTNTEEGDVEIPSGLTEYQQNRERYKAQCLKLLEWLKMPCEEHDHRTLCDPDGYCLTKDCSWCISELESKLKEGR